MSAQPIISTLYAILMAAMPIVLVPLILATLFGFIVALMQAVTQTQEQTLPQSVKMLVVAAVLLTFGGALTLPFYRASAAIFENFWTYKR